MIYDNMVLPENTLPLDNIMSAQNAANLQNMLTAQNNRMVSQNTTLQDMLAQQNAAITQNNTTVPQGAVQNRMSMDNKMGTPNMMPSNSMNTMGASQANRSNANNKNQAMQQLAQTGFAVHEAVLYLDTHPNDQNALEYYRRKQQQFTQSSENYQKVVGPINAGMVDTNSGSWQWVETPWPWEIEEV
ncbi:MAG: spore coat protein CotJB [Candidatus Fimivivens sp.]|nr:spore coat protein CotJB [Candidatus Fimivivens sp.]